MKGTNMSSIDLNIAKKIIEGAQKKSSELKSNFCISVVDPRGDLITFIREDGAPWRSVYISQGKAAASAAFMQPSGKLAENGPNPIHQGLMSMLGGRMIPGQGALPVFYEEEIIGAVGVSGGTPQEDEEIALAGIKYAGYKVS
ncbi:MAG: DNA polymerase III subunit delta' [Chloroflexi bacterium]|nr:DNA polymerase III subunit delta' [Chloroflexota bacterium]|tara:strand:+ start:777 stop:1205 length:429 start_codon:yes stop_codon:yes gene_type:complete